MKTRRGTQTPIHMTIHTIVMLLGWVIEISTRIVTYNEKSLFYKTYKDDSCLNFWDESGWFLSLRVFGLLSSSLLLFPQRFGRYVFRLFSGVCRTREPTWNFELRRLLNQRGVTYSDYVSHNWVQVLSILVLLPACCQDWTCNLQMIVSLEA